VESRTSRAQRAGTGIDRNRFAERAVLGALRVDVDPLVVAGGVGEHVDPGLVDLDPRAHADFSPTRVDRASSVSMLVVVGLPFAGE